MSYVVTPLRSAPFCSAICPLSQKSYFKISSQGSTSHGLRNFLGAINSCVRPIHTGHCPGFKGAINSCVRPIHTGHCPDFKGTPNKWAVRLGPKLVELRVSYQKKVISLCYLTPIVYLCTFYFDRRAGVYIVLCTIWSLWAIKLEK